VGARGRAGGESPPERPAVARGEEEVGRRAAFAACRRVATRLPGASPTGMGFSGRVRPCGRCRGSLAVHRGGPPCPSMRGREATGLAGCSPTRSLHHTRTGDFEDLTCRGELGTCIPNHLACRLRRLLSRATSSSGPPFASSSTSRWMSRRRWPRSPGVVQRLPLHRFSCRSPVSWTPPRARARQGLLTGRGLPWRSRAARPGCRPRRLVTTSPVSSSCRLPGCCTRRRSWGSARFTSPRLSPRRRSPRRAPALRSLVPRGKQPDPLTRAVRRLVTRFPLPVHASPSPLPPRPSPLPAGTSRSCSSPGAVRPGPRCRDPERPCSPGLGPRRPRVAALARGQVRQRTFERTPSR
jgi:hypothetical protein